MIIFSLDPSMSATGWAILDTSRKTIRSGCLFISKEIPIEKGKKKSFIDIERARYLIRSSNVLILSFGCKHIAAEIPTGSINAGSAKIFGILKGAIAGIIECLKLSSSYHLPTQVKKSLAGEIYASKIAVSVGVGNFIHKNKYKWTAEMDNVESGTKSWDISLEAQYDAMAVGITAIRELEIEDKSFKRGDQETQRRNKKKR